MRLRTVAAIAVVLVVAAVVTVIAIVTSMDFSQYKGLIEAKAKEATGRELAIRGELKVVVGLSPALAVSDVTFANAPGGTRPQMLTARRFEAQIDLLPLLFGDLRVRRLVLLDPDILLETDARGRGNWEFDTPASGTAHAPEPAPTPTDSKGRPLSLPQVNAVEIRNARLVYRDGRTNESQTVLLTRALLKADSDTAPLQIDIEGVANDIKLQLNGEIGSVAALGSPGTAFPIRLTAKVPDVITLRVDGQMTQPLQGRGYDLKINAEAGEIATVAALADVRLPVLGPLKAALRLTETQNRPSLSEINLEAGKADLVLVKLSGAARNPLALQGLALDVGVEGSEIGNLSGLQIPALPQPLPAIPALGPFRATAKIGNENNRLSIPSLAAELGREDLLLVTLSGAIRDPLERKGYSLTLSGNAKDLQQVARTLKLNAPWEGPLSLSARIADAGADRYALSNLNFAAAGSDLSGEGTLSLAGERPAVTASIASTMVDLAKLLPEKSPSSGPAPAPGSPTASPTAAPKNDGRVFPADPLPFDLLNTADAELRYRADAIRLQTGPVFRQSSVQVALRNGELAVRPLATELAQGKMTGEATLNARSGAATIKFQTRGLDLGALDKEVPGDDLVTGAKTDIDLDLRGSGRSIRAIAATLDGTLLLHTGAGSFSSRYTDMLGVGDLMEIIGRSLPRLDRTPLNCVVAKLDMAGGVATIRGLVADTQRLTLDGEGRIDLRSEQPEILLNTHTKVVSLMSLLPPIRVAGTLQKPSFFPDVGAGAVGAVGGLLGTVLGAPGNIGDLLLGGGSRPAVDICAQALARATGRPAPARSTTTQPAQQQPAQPQQQQQQRPANPLDEIGRGLRGIFGQCGDARRRDQGGARHVQDRRCRRQRGRPRRAYRRQAAEDAAGRGLRAAHRDAGRGHRRRVEGLRAAAAPARGDAADPHRRHGARPPEPAARGDRGAAPELCRDRAALSPCRGPGRARRAPERDLAAAARLGGDPPRRHAVHHGRHRRRAAGRAQPRRPARGARRHGPVAAGGDLGRRRGLGLAGHRPGAVGRQDRPARRLRRRRARRHLADGEMGPG
jgi:uncharacterized protein involved in outer membrane biogenesis